MGQTLGVDLELRERIAEVLRAKAERINAEAGDIDNIDGYKITAAQCNDLNKGNPEAVAKFFKENKRRLYFQAHRYCRNLGYRPIWDEKYKCWSTPLFWIDDCLNQLYVDMLQGYLIFYMRERAIIKTVCHSFRYAAVGGFGDEDGVYMYEPRGVRK